MNMRLIVFFMVLIVFFTQCKKYKDPNATTDPRISNLYCNIPSAVNYNWGFPGIPDNSTCIFPSDVFEGNYFLRDSFYNDNLTIDRKDSFDVTITAIDSTKIAINGFCNSMSIYAKANRFYKFSLDSNTLKGQVFCNTLDTISGEGHTGYIGDSIIHFSYVVITDTGNVYHISKATKK